MMRPSLKSGVRLLVGFGVLLLSLTQILQVFQTQGLTQIGNIFIKFGLAIQLDVLHLVRLQVLLLNLLHFQRLMHLPV